MQFCWLLVLTCLNVRHAIVWMLDFEMASHFEIDKPVPTADFYYASCHTFTTHTHGHISTGLS